ncbi:TIGR01777 family oxidoreductase [Acinetobacter variabilis]|uniref:TIGR01777 family oxidoreductase n=1 Tax=Acinetobacter variabilis TaxID=70346 RepID=UPI0021D1354D|nr:TIGR01777 family oxidoreductase [Acinetobacter variabilis]MCU4628678.1 TIGR01777 family oxidoreductase [Acinetobacter variabilis]
MYKPVVLMTGASGFIGSHLVKFLLARDYAVIGLTRQKKLREEHPDFHWINDLEELKNHQIDYVINLAGESIGQGRWTAARKKKLLDSRLNTTKQLYDYLEKNQIKPKRIISTSAIGYYGIDPQEHWDRVCTEQSPPQSIFMSELCEKWEKLALSYTGQNTKIVRFAVVFGQGGGILPQMLLPIKLNIFGRIGHGRQPVTWVHLQDVMRAIEFLMQQSTQQQVFNVVTPEKVSQVQFARIAAQVLKRKPLLPLPACSMKMMLGEQSQLILNGQYVQPKALQEAGFKFNYPTLKEALIDILNH